VGSALARHGLSTSSARQLPLGHTALGRALLALMRHALLPAAQRSVDDLIAYLRHPGIVEPPDAVDRAEADLRQQAAGDAGSLRGRGPALQPALNALEELRRTRDPAAALPDHVRRLLAAPHRAGAALLSRAEQLDARAATAVIEALVQLQQLDQGRPTAVELIDLLESLQVPAHGLASVDAVLVAEPLAIRARRFRRVFVTGLCEGEFPSPQPASGDPFLGDDRRRELALASGLVLAQPADPLHRERYLLYACVSRATERVTFSYRSSDEDGNVVMPSPFLDDIAALFPDDWREHRRRRLLADVVWTVEAAPSERERIVASAFVDALGAATDTPPETRFLSEQALTHVRHRQIVSAGALEIFGACPVRWLVERQLDSHDLQPDPEPLVRGSFIHAVLERVFARLGGPLTRETLTEAEAVLGEELRGSAAAEARDKLAPGQPVEVRTAILRGIEAELRRYLRYEAGDGSDWEPVRTELRFGLDLESDGAFSPVELDDGRDRVLLSGVVDRVDADPSDRDRVIVRDYKSGAKRDTWPGARWLSDRQIQVALYMIAVQRLLGVRAVAGFYQPLAGEDLRPRGVYNAGADVGDHAVFRDELSDAELEALLDEIEDEAVTIAVTLRRGELTPCPEECSPNGTCRYPGICWSER
jgi:RecB family exonuclease